LARRIEEGIRSIRDGSTAEPVPIRVRGRMVERSDSDLSHAASPLQLVILLESATGPIHLRLDLTGARQLARWILGLAAEALPEGDLISSIEEGALLFGLENLLSHLAAHLPELDFLQPMTTECIGLRLTRDDSEVDESLRGALQVGDLAVAFSVEFPSAVAPQLRDALAAMDEEHRDAELRRWIANGPDLVAQFVADLGRLDLDAEELADLTPGDCLVLPIPAESQSGQATWPAPIQLRPLTAEPAGFRLLGNLNFETGDFMVNQITCDHPSNSSSEDDFNDAPSTPPSAHSESRSPLVRIPGLSVTLKLELGQLQIRIRELAELSPGSVIPLDDAGDLHITVSNGGRVLGLAELIRMDGRPVIRLTEWA